MIPSSTLRREFKESGAWFWALIYRRNLLKLSSRQLLEKFAGSDPNKWKKFWNILLCSDEAGPGLLRLDEAIPFAVNVLQRWSRESRIIYLTGRPDSTRQLTLGELKRFGFPVDDTELMMFDPKDWENFTSMGSLVGARVRVFSDISNKYDVMKVIDDYPTFFNVYRQFNVPDRIGLSRPKRFSPEDYMSQGATRVIKSWSQLLDEPVEPKHQPTSAF